MTAAPARLEILREEVRVPDYARDGSHGVRIWVYDDDKPDGGSWAIRSAIDAREMVGGGMASFDGPNTTRESGESNQAAATHEELTRSLGRLSKPDLARLCDDHGIHYGGSDTRSSLVARLAAASISPTPKGGS